MKAGTCDTVCVVLRTSIVTDQVTQTQIGTVTVHAQLNLYTVLYHATRKQKRN